jgi:malonyl-CoA/methylmalonyl-CoA synthetase
VITAPGWQRHLPESGPFADPSEAVAPATSATAPWEAHWARAPGRPVVHDPDVGWLSAGALEERSRAAALGLLGAGLEPGDRVVVSAGASVDAVVAYVGALRAGMVVVPVNTAYRQPEVAHIVGDAAPRAAVVDDRQRGAWMAAASAGPLVVTGVGDALPAGGAGAGGLPARGPADPALLIYTSGTTGTPKGALLSHGNLVAGIEALRLAWRWSPDDRLTHTLPLFHLHGLGAGINGTLHAGASVLLRPRFDPGDVAASPRELGATLFFGVPTMYTRLASHPDLARLGALRLCVSGSAPLPPDVFAAVEAGSGHAILERYGTTETMLTVSNPYDGERRPGTVGFPLPGVELRLAGGGSGASGAAAPSPGTAGGAPGGAGATGGDGRGEVEVRAPMVFGGYWGRPVATAEAFTADGWFRTGDIGALDGDGYLHIVGRSKELIITGGYNVYPREVEEALRHHPAVAEVAVAGVADDTWGEAVTAWVVPAGAGGPADEAALLAFARDRLAPYKCPKSVRFVDALPRNALGKVLKHELR